MNTSIRRKLFRSSFTGVLAAVIITYIFGSLIGIVESEKKRREIASNIQEQLVIHGRMAVLNTCLAITPMVEENGFSAIQGLISASVKENSYIVRGIYMDKNRQPWAMVTSRNPGGAVSDSKPLDDSISLWASGLTAIADRKSDLNGEEVIEVAGPVLSGGEHAGTLRYTMSTAAMRKSIEKLNKDIIGNGIMVVVLLTLVSAVILALSYRAAHRQARAITGPLHELTAAANAIAAGNYQKKVAVESDDEVGTLAIHFESMRQKVREYTDNLEKKVAERTDELQAALGKINEELVAAQRIQQALFPADLGDSRNISVSAVCMPVGQVSGDFYDVVRLSPYRTLFAVLDVTGHGVPAALGTAMVKNSIVRNTRDHAVSPKELINRMNAEIIDYVPKTQLISAFVGVVDIAGMTFSFASAGHPPALLVRPAGSGEVQALKSKGMLMCVVPNLLVQEESVPVRPGDKIFLCTDGLFDLFVKLNVRAGLEKMGQFLLEIRDLSVDMVAQKLLAMHNGLAKKGDVADDATVVGIQIKGPHPLP